MVGNWKFNTWEGFPGPARLDRISSETTFFC